MQLTGPRVIAIAAAAGAPILVEGLARTVFPVVLDARAMLTLMEVVIALVFGVSARLGEDTRHRLPPASAFGDALVERPAFRVSSVRRLVSLSVLMLAPFAALIVGSAYRAVALPVGAAYLLLVVGACSAATPTRRELKRARRAWLALAHSRKWITEHAGLKPGWPPRLLGEVGGVPVAIELRQDRAYPRQSWDSEEWGGLFPEVYSTVISVGGASSPVVYICFDGVVGVGLERAMQEAVARAAAIGTGVSTGGGTN